MQILDFLETDTLQLNDISNQFSIKHKISCLNSKLINNLHDFDIAILGIPEDRGSNNTGSCKAPNKIRESLYLLSYFFNNLKIIDLGNIKTGKTVNDTHDRIIQVLTGIIDQNIFPIILGGSRELTLAVYKTFQLKNKILNLTSINSSIDINKPEDKTGNSYLSEILLAENNNLFNFSNIGYQSYFVSSSQIDLMNKLHYDYYRVGYVRSNLLSIEPVLRDTNILELSVNSIKQSDAPAYYKPSPNGFYSEEICQIARYAGISDNINAFCLFDLNPGFDINNQTSNLAAQIIWYFIEGYVNRISEDPANNEKDFTKFHVQHDSFDLKLDFLKSNKTGRWWLKLPYKSNLISETSALLACSREDYTLASNNEIPDRIWKFYKKML